MLSEGVLDALDDDLADRVGHFDGRRALEERPEGGKLRNGLQLFDEDVLARGRGRKASGGHGGRAGRAARTHRTFAARRRRALLGRRRQRHRIQVERRAGRLVHVLHQRLLQRHQRNLRAINQQKVL